MAKTPTKSRAAANVAATAASDAIGAFTSRKVNISRVSATDRFSQRERIQNGENSVGEYTIRTGIATPYAQPREGQRAQHWIQDILNRFFDIEQPIILGERASSTVEANANIVREFVQDWVKKNPLEYGDFVEIKVGLKDSKITVFIDPNSVNKPAKTKAGIYLLALYLRRTQPSGAAVETEVLESTSSDDWTV